MSEPIESDVREDEEWQDRVQKLARTFPYPPVPNIAGKMRASLRSRAHQDQPRPAARAITWAVLILAILFGVFAAVPELRAAVLETLRIGAVRIFPIAEPMPADTPTSPTSTPLASILDLPGETTLHAAREHVEFDIRLPGYPPGLRPPDRVFLQGGRAPDLTLVWLQSEHPEYAEFSLSIIPSHGFVDKYYPWQEQVTSVNGSPAIWLTGVHELYHEASAPNGSALLVRRTVQQNVLIWEAGSLTYRLESDFALDEARRIAESLR